MIRACRMCYALLRGLFWKNQSTSGTLIVMFRKACARAAKISDLTQKAADLGMSHVAITDHGNMYGIPKFVLAARRAGIKPIVGCEFYIIDGDATKREKGTKRYHQIMWAKDAEGYQNLVKLCSYGYTDGYYYKPRIDKNILRQHAKGLLEAFECGLAAGKGAVEYRGKMIDLPVVERAKELLRNAQALNKG